MSKKSVKFFCVILVAVLLLTLAGCNPSAPKYTIQYTDDSGTHKIEVEMDMPYSLDSIPTRYGYEFLGLFDAEEGGTQYVTASGSSLSVFSDGKNIVLFPQFRAKEYTLFLNYGQADQTGAGSIQVKFGELITNLPLGLTTTGAHFVGWNTSADGTGIRLSSAQSMEPSNAVVNRALAELSNESGVIPIYAVFEVNMYTVRFYSADGSKLLLETKVPHGSLVSDVAPKTLDDGTNILSWSLSRNGAVFNGAIEQDDYLFFVKSVGYNITYVDGDSVDTKQVVQGERHVILEPQPKEGYNFQYWEGSDGINYEPNDFITPTSSLTLTARWDPRQYNLTLDANGGEVSIKSKDVQYDSDFTLPIPTRKGCVFDGWFSEEGDRITDNKGQSISKFTFVSLTVVKARWYVIVVYDDGVSQNTVKVLPGETFTVAAAPKNEGYDFQHWEGSDGTKYEPGKAVEAKESLTLTAKWAPHQYTVTLDANGGTISESTLTIVYDSEFTLPVPTRTGYTFDGWYDASGKCVADEHGKGVGKFRFINSGLTFSAKWTPIQCTVYLDSNGGTVSDSTKKIQFGSEFTLPVPTRANWDFQGWYDEKNKRVTDEKGNGIGSFGYAESSVKLIAKWEEHKYSIVLNANGGSVSSEKVEITYDSEFALPIPTRIGFIFEGWYSKANERITDAKGKGVGRFVYTSLTEVVAHWIPNPGVFQDNTQYKITDSGRVNQHHDTLTFTSLFGVSLSTLQAMGYTKIKVYIQIFISEIDDGYQAIVLTRALTSSNDDAIWTKADIEHGVGVKDTSNYEHDFVVDLYLSSFSETFYIMYGASGTGGDDWYRNSITVYFTIS